MEKQQKLTPHQAVKQQMNRTKFEASQAVKNVQEAARKAEMEVRMTSVAGCGKNGGITKGYVDAARVVRDRLKVEAKTACEASIKAAKRAQLDAERLAEAEFTAERDKLEAQLVESNKPIHTAYEAAKAEIMKEAETEIESVVRALNEKLVPLNEQLKALEAKDAEYAAKVAAEAAAAAAAPPAEAPAAP